MCRTCMELRLRRKNDKKVIFRFPERGPKKRLSWSGEPFVNLIRSRLPGALLVTIGLQTLAAFVVIHLEAAFFLEVTHV